MLIRIVLLVILLAFRFYDLGVRPPHHDEAVNGWFVDGILGRGYYIYDPNNYHGPLFFYFLTLFRGIFGRSVEALRVDPLIFGALVTATPVLFRQWIGNRGMWIAMFFFAVSPAMVFYSRYSIHEMMFAFACILYFYFWLRMRTSAFDWKLVTGLGVSLGAMACLKENFVIYIGSILIAEVMTQIADFNYSVPKAVTNLRSQVVSRGFGVGLGAAVGMALVMILLCYSAFFQDENGFMNFFRAFAAWSDTGSDGHGHGKEFLYWIKLMGEFEWMALLGLMLAPFALVRVPSEIRLLSVLSVGLWLAYSIVHYKTPWCVLSFYWGLVMVAAYWLDRWLKPMLSATQKTGRKARAAVASIGELNFQDSARALKAWQWGVYALLLGGFGVSAYQSWDAAYANPDQDGHLYIYGQTYRDFMGPMNELIEEAKANPSLLTSLRIQIISTYTWPLPYVLGEFKAVGYYGEANAPQVLDSEVIMMDETLEPKFASRIKDRERYRRQVVRSRQWASPMVIYRKASR